MMTTCEVFSDMSQRHGAVGYCVMIRQLMRPIIVRHGDITDHADRSDAEIMALRIGVSLCPRDVDGVIAYTDLNDLPAMMQGVNVSYQAKIASALRLLDIEAADVHAAALDAIRTRKWTALGKLIRISSKHEPDFYWDSEAACKEAEMSVAPIPAQGDEP